MNAIISRKTNEVFVFRHSKLHIQYSTRLLANIKCWPCLSFHTSVSAPDARNNGRSVNTTRWSHWRTLWSDRLSILIVVTSTRRKRRYSCEIFNSKLVDKHAMTIVFHIVTCVTIVTILSLVLFSFFLEVIIIRVLRYKTCTAYNF